ncbi:hypothetical protein [Mesorhizobium sp. ES1-1]|uniref:hypothetical protein n=1 Tax=Mesorhizobium sp. ES1-1 TaxID=2876629 RepID=UPI001CCFCA69|nr:hypothetical protein [Mesorhizobium sp. ES1-1]MBZ9675787.1 hypothetical protein [Mesorhizobium sp. ES1-1]
MKKIILAVMIGLSAVSSVLVPAKAASVVISTDDNNDGQYRRHWRHHEDRSWHRHRHEDQRWHRNRHCSVKIIKTRRHHHWVVKKVRVCDWRRG